MRLGDGSLLSGLQKTRSFRVLLLKSLCWVRAASGPFFGEQFICTESGFKMGVFQRPLTLILLQKYRSTNGRRIVIQIGGVYATFCQKEGILLQKYCDRNGRRIAKLFKSIGVRGRFDSPDLRWVLSMGWNGSKRVKSGFWGAKVGNTRRLHKECAGLLTYPECAKGAEKASCGETVAQKGASGGSVFFPALLRFPL